MTLLERLESHGFTNASITNMVPGKVKITVRVRTMAGWVYEKFDPEDQTAIDAWAAKHSPAE